MEPSPPKSHRTRRQIHRPFYESPKKTSAEIISEARSSVRSLETQRPFTPADGQRRLFSGRNRDARPPSAISIASSYSESRPPSGRLTPIDQRADSNEIASLADLCNDTEKTFDCNENIVSPTKQPSFKESIIPVKSAEPLFSKSRKYPSIQKRPSLLEKENRRVQSGPKERSPPKEQDELVRSNSYDNIDQSIKTTDNNKNKSNPDKDIIFYEENLKPLLQQMKLNHLHSDEDSLIINFDILVKTLDIGNLLGKSKLGSKRRTDILSTVYKCTTGDNPQLMLKLAKLFLLMEVSGKNLDAACKIMYKVSRDKKDDQLFIKENIIGNLVNLIACKSISILSECMVYLMGTIKFLSLNSDIMKEFIKYDALKVMSSVLETFTGEVKKENLKDNCNILIQIISVLNNFASNSSLMAKFMEYNIVVCLISVTPRYSQDTDNSMTLSRLLSKLSMSSSICATLQTQHIEIILDVLNRHYKHQETVVRLCYVLGNIANFNEELRLDISNGKESFLKVLMFYFEALIKEPTSKKDRGSSTPIEDTMIKVIRIFANICMNVDCGREYCNNTALIDVLLKLTEKCDELMLSYELSITIAAVVNNLSYYISDNYLALKQNQFAKALIPVLFSDNMDVVLEAVRVLGNFTQSKSVRDTIISNKVLDVLVTLLDSNNPELIFATCGVLINMMVDVEYRKYLKHYDGITKLLDCLRDLAESDWLLASMICQILWNYSEHITTSVEYFGDEQTDDLITLLNELNDEGLACDYENQTHLNNDTIEMLKQTWRLNFQPVATLLLQRIETHHSMLEPIIVEPD